MQPHGRRWAPHMRRPVTWKDIVTHMRGLKTWVGTSLDRKRRFLRGQGQRPLVVVMAKVAVLGRVKTRLGREIGPVHATRFYRATRAAVLMRLIRDPRFETVLAVDPAPQAGDRGVRVRVKRVGQVRRDLGGRMQALVVCGRCQPVVVIGTDIPGVRAQHVSRAVKKLRGARAVLAPAPDGGFWLYGARACPALVAPFDGVRWSHAETRADVLRNLGAVRVATADELSDVDSAEDLAPLAGRWGRVV
jgi:uncharacterized protein